MALLSVGAPCSTCSTVDFLPFRCPSCSALFCRDHIQLHPCAASSSFTNTESVPGPSRIPSADQRGRCQAKGCLRVSLEALAGYGWIRSALPKFREGFDEEDGEEAQERIAKEVRCPGCGSSYCSIHRQQAAHSCSAPPDHVSRQNAAEVRKTRAAAILAHTFPDQAGRVIPRPPPAVDTSTSRTPHVEAPRQVLERLSPSGQPGTVPGPPAPAPSEGKAKQTKAEKLWEVHVRKVRSLAEPLDGKKREGVNRRVFEWAVDESGSKARAWLEGRQWEAQPARAWAPVDMACGRVFDLMVEKSKLSRSRQDDPQQRLSLIALEALPDQPRSTRPIDLSDPASTLVEGSLVVLIRGHPPLA